MSANRKQRRASQSVKTPKNSKEPCVKETTRLIALFNQGNFAAAEILARTMTTHFPQFGFGWKSLGTLLKAQGRTGESLESMKKAVALMPDDAESHSNLGVTFRDLGRLEEAEYCYNRAVALRPDFAEAHNNLGVVLKETGRPELAEVCYLRALEIKPNLAEIHTNLGDALNAQGRLEESEACYCYARTLGLETDTARFFDLAETQRRAGRSSEAISTLRTYLQYNHDDINARSNLGALLCQIDHLDEAVEELRKVVTAEPSHLQGWLNLGMTLVKLERLNEAEDAYHKALVIQPDNKLAEQSINQIYAKVVPRWHFLMMNDILRNEFYLQAITRAVTKWRLATGKPPLVLEIGTGSGLLSMMAARAGAEHIVTCEMVRPVAEMASEIIAKNGWSQLVTVLNKKSSNLVIGSDLPRRADILISEIFDAGLLGENVLLAVEHARRELLVDDAIILPAHAKVWMMPVESQEIHELFRANNINGCGFDLEPFNRFAKQNYDQLALRRYAFKELADPVAVLDIDFSNEVPDSEYIFTLYPKNCGILHAWVFWFTIDFDNEVFLDNSPYAETTSFAQAVQTNPTLRAVSPDSGISVRVVQTQHSIKFFFSDDV